MGAISLIPRTMVNGYLRALRIPVSAAERLARQQDNESWPPSLAFERFEAKVEGAAGVVLRDDELLQSATLREAKIAKLQEARTLKAASDVERENARDKQRKREAEITAQRGKAARVAAERKRAIDNEAELKKRDAEHEAAKKQRAVKSQERAQKEVIERRERATKAAALDAEAEALDLTDEALEAREKVDLIDKTLEGNKEARKTG
jgi:trichohyalin